MSAAYYYDNDRMDVDIQANKPFNVLDALINPQPEITPALQDYDAMDIESWAARVAPHSPQKIQDAMDVEEGGFAILHNLLQTPPRSSITQATPDTPAKQKIIERTSARKTLFSDFTSQPSGGAWRDSYASSTFSTFAR